MKKNKESAIGKLSRWLPGNRSRKIKNAIYITIHVISVGCFLMSLFLGYRVWQVGFINATLNLILLILCLAAAFGLLVYRHSIKDKLSQLILKNSSQISKQVAKRVARKSINKSSEWLVKGIQDGVDKAQDLVDQIHIDEKLQVGDGSYIVKDHPSLGQKKAKNKTEITRNARSLSRKSHKESIAIPNIPATTTFKPATLCLACGRPQRVGARFCDGCGQPLPIICPYCGFSLRAKAKFCDQCGQTVK